jgi:uncharacterized membrane protein
MEYEIYYLCNLLGLIIILLIIMFHFVDADSANSGNKVSPTSKVQDILKETAQQVKANQ